MISNGSSIVSLVCHMHAAQSDITKKMWIWPVIKTKPTLKSFDLIRYAKSHQRTNAYGAYFQLEIVTGILGTRCRLGEKENRCDSFFRSVCKQINSAQHSYKFVFKSYKSHEWINYRTKWRFACVDYAILNVRIMDVFNVCTSTHAACVKTAYSIRMNKKWFKRNAILLAVNRIGNAKVSI